MDWPKPGRGGGIHGLPRESGVSADCLLVSLPQNGCFPLHSQYVSLSSDSITNMS